MKDWIDFFLFLVMVVLNISVYCDNRKKYKEKPSELLLKILKFYRVSIVIAIIVIVIYLVFLIVDKF